MVIKTAQSPPLQSPRALVVYTVPRSASLPRPESDMLRAASGELYRTLDARLCGCSRASAGRSPAPGAPDCPPAGCSSLRADMYLW
jgi:hypothetical protein